VKRIACLLLAGLVLGGCGSTAKTSQKSTEEWAHNIACGGPKTPQMEYECEHPQRAKAEEAEEAREHPNLYRAEQEEGG
jgi:hypothetical protein